MPELPPVVDASASSSLGAIRELWSWVVSGDARISGRRLAGALGAALAIVVVGVVAWRAYALGGVGGGGPPPELTMPRADAGAGTGPELGNGSTPTASAAGRVVVAHVAGAVVRPGLYRLGGAPRVADALDAAGGPAPDADLDAVNLAATVADGERVYVPRKGEVPPPLTGGVASVARPSGPLDLNTATAEELEALPGIGPATASAILAYRQEHGRFRTVDELLEVRGIGEARLAELRSMVRVR